MTELENETLAGDRGITPVGGGDNGRTAMLKRGFGALALTAFAFLIIWGTWKGDKPVTDSARKLMIRQAAAFEPVAERKLAKGELGHLKKAGLGAHRHLVEFLGRTEQTVGESVTVEAFQPGDPVKVSGISIGKGFQGTIKRHRFHRGPVSHGSHNVRKPGSIGASATPSRVFKGMKMAGRMGGKRVTQVGLTVHSVDVERNLLLVKGAVPGPKNAIVEVREDPSHGRS